MGVTYEAQLARGVGERVPGLTGVFWKGVVGELLRPGGSERTGGMTAIANQARLAPPLLALLAPIDAGGRPLCRKPPPLTPRSGRCWRSACAQSARQPSAATAPLPRQKRRRCRRRGQTWVHGGARSISSGARKVNNWASTPPLPAVISKAGICSSPLQALKHGCTSHVALTGRACRRRRARAPPPRALPRARS